MYTNAYTILCSLTRINSKPQQLSTYALTLFSYNTEVNGDKVQVGKLVIFEFYLLSSVSV